MTWIVLVQNGYDGEQLTFKGVFAEKRTAVECATLADKENANGSVRLFEFNDGTTEFWPNGSPMNNDDDDDIASNA